MPAKAVCVLKGSAGVEGTLTFVEQADGKEEKDSPLIRAPVCSSAFGSKTLLD
jgi:hypothetical protein